MDSPLVKDTKVETSQHSPAPEEVTNIEGTKLEPQSSGLPIQSPKEASMDIDSNGESTTNEPNTRQAGREESTHQVTTNASSGSMEQSDQKPPAPSENTSVLDGKEDAVKVPESEPTAANPGSDAGLVAAKATESEPTAENPSSDPSPTAPTPTPKADTNGAATLATDAVKDEAKSTTKPLPFRQVFDRVLNVASPEPTQDDMNAIVIQLLRHGPDDGNDMDSSGGSSRESKTKKQDKKTKGKRSTSSSQESANKRQRRIRASQNDAFMDDKDLGEIMMDSSGDADDGQVAAGKKKRRPAARKKTDDDSFRASDSDTDMDDVSENNQKREEATPPPAPEAPIIGMDEFLTKSRTEIQSASSLVSRSLLVGLWPSPYRSLEPVRIFNRHPEEYSAHAEHMSMVGVAIETFSNDIISQAILEEIQYCPEHKRSEPRAYLATLLYLREVLVLNAATIFGPSAFLTGLEPDFAVVRSAQDNGIPVQDAAMLTVRLLATAVVINGLSQLGEESGERALAEELTAAFLDMVEKYELGDSEFSGCLSRITDQVIPYFPSRRNMPEMERRVWKASLNYQRHHHPLISPHITEVEPTAVHVSLIQPARSTPDKQSAK